MAGAYAVFVEGLTGNADFDALRDDIKLMAAQAINKTAERGRTKAAREIRDQINLPASYVSPANKRLYVSKKAQRGDLEARIAARTRATSLARFVQGQAQLNKQGVRVEIQPGKARFMKRAFLVRLRAGGANLDTKNNLGLAVRLRPGEVLRNKSDVRRLDRGLYLLYGPSVSQVFMARDGSGVAEEISPELADWMESEFMRIIDRHRT